MAKKKSFWEMHEEAGGTYSSPERVQQEQEWNQKRKEKTAEINRRAVTQPKQTAQKAVTSTGNQKKSTGSGKTKITAPTTGAVQEINSLLFSAADRKQAIKKGQDPMFAYVNSEVGRAKDEAAKQIPAIEQTIRDLKKRKKPVDKEIDSQITALQGQIDSTRQQAADMNQIALDFLPEEDKKALENYVNQRRTDWYDTLLQGTFGNGVIGTPGMRAEQQAAALAEKYGWDTVKSLAETLERQQNAEATARAQQKGAEIGQEHPVLGSAASIPMNVASGIPALFERIRGLGTSTGQYPTLDPNNAGNLLGAMGSSIQGQVASDIEGEDPNLLRKAGSYAYRGGMSALESGLRAATGKAGTVLLSGLGSFEQNVAKASAQGASPEKAAAMGLTNATIEALSEEIPLDKLLDAAKGGKQTFTQALKLALAQAGIEATTEEVSLVGSTLAEAAILKDKSEFNQYIQSRIAEGVDPQTARDEALRNLLDEALDTAIVSAVSGGGMSGVNSLIANYEAKKQSSPQPRQESAQAPDTPLQGEAADPRHLAQQQEMAREAAQAMEQEQQSQAAQQEAPQAPPATDPLLEGIQTPVAPAQSPQQAAPGREPLDTAIAETLGQSQDQQQAPAAVDTPKDTARPASVFNLSDTKVEAEPTPAGESPKNGSLATPISSASDISIPTVGENVNGNMGNSVGTPGIKGTGAAEANFTQKPAYNATLSADNAQPDRASDVRPMELPKTDINGNPVSAVTGNAYGSKITTDELASLMEEPTARGDFSYARITNDQATQTAMDTIAAAGDWESAYNQWAKDVGAGKAGAEMAARGALFLNHFAKEGNKTQWLNTLADMQDLGTNTAQGLQAMRLIRELAPQDKVMLVKMATNRLGQEMGVEFTIDQSLYDAYNSAETDDARNAALDDIQQAVADQIPSTALDKWNALRYTNMLGNLKTNVRNIAGNIGAGAMYRVKDQVAATMEDVLYAATGGKFERTKSHTVSRELLNACGKDFDNVSGIVSDGGKFGVKDSPRDQFTREVMERRRIFKSDNKILNKVLAPMEAYRKGTNWMMNNKYFGDEAFGKAAYARALAGYLKAHGVTAEQFQQMAAERPKAAAGTPKAIIPEGTRVKAADRQNYGTILKYNETDNTYLVRFVSPSGHTANVTLSADILTPVGKRPDTLGPAPKPEQKMEFVDYARAYAIREAQEATFHDNSALARTLSKLKRDTGVVGEGIIPFAKTPANVLTRAYEFSPLGLIDTTATAVAAAKGGGDVTGTDVINSLSKTLTGTAIFTLGAWLKHQGFLTGGPDDDDEKDAFDKLNGDQNYAIRFTVGGKTYNYTFDWLTPAAMPLFMGAQLMDILDKGFENLTFADLENVFTSIADPMLQMSMLQSLNDSLDNIKYTDNNLGQFFINAAVSYLTQGLSNTLVGQIERSTEKNRMTTYVDKNSQLPAWMQRQIGSLSQKIPGWDYQQTEYRNAYGETEENEGGLLYNLLSPGYISEEKSTALSQELYRLNDAGVDGNVFPDTPDTTVSYTDSEGNSHKDYHLTAGEADRLKEVTGKTATTLLSDMIETDLYKAMSDQQKADAVRKVYDYARELGRTEAIDGYQGMDAWMEAAEKNPTKAILDRVVKSGFDDAFDSLTHAWEYDKDPASAVSSLENAYSVYSGMSKEEQKKFKENTGGKVGYFLDAKDAGIDGETFTALYKTYSDIDAQDSDASAKARNWAYYLNKEKAAGHITASQEETLKDSMAYYVIFPADAGKFNGLTEAGLSADSAQKVVGLMDGITGTGKDGTVRYIDKYKAIAGSSLSARDKETAFLEYAPDSMDEKYNYAMKNMTKNGKGITIDDFVKAYQVTDEYSKKKEQTDAWQAMGYTAAEANNLYKLYSGKLT